MGHRRRLSLPRTDLVWSDRRFFGDGVRIGAQHQWAEPTTSPQEMTGVGTLAFHDRPDASSDTAAVTLPAVVRRQRLTISVTATGRAESTYTPDCSSRTASRAHLRNRPSRGTPV